jgi:hypothetical protein
MLLSRTPGADLLLVHPHRTLGIFETACDPIALQLPPPQRIPPYGRPIQCPVTHGIWEIAAVHRSTDQEEFPARSRRRTLPRPHRFDQHLPGEGPFRPDPLGKLFPLGRRTLLNNGPDFHGSALRVVHLISGRGSPSRALTFRDIRMRRGPRDGVICMHIQQLPRPSIREPIAKF